MNSKEELRTLIRTLKKATGLSQIELSVKAGYKESRLAQALAREDGQEPVIKRLQLVFAETLKNATIVRDPYFEETKTTIVAEPNNENSYLQKRRNLKTAHSIHTAPLIPAKAQAGYVRAIDQQQYMDTLEQFALPPGVDPHGAHWAYWEVQGDSMEPAFRNGDVILTSQVHRYDWENIRNFYVYVIVTDEAVLIKRVFAKNQLEWVLISENEEMYNQQLLPVEYVKQLWVFRRKIEAYAPPTKKFEIKV